jgi:hypothetical protein
LKQANTTPLAGNPSWVRDGGSPTMRVVSDG